MIIEECFQGVDGVIVNGNHFVSQKQIVIIHRQKEEFLSRERDRLTDVQAIILDEHMQDAFPFLRESIADIDEIPVIRISDEEAITNVFRKVFQRRPALKGLVFAGGRSVPDGPRQGIYQLPWQTST